MKDFYGKPIAVRNPKAKQLLNFIDKVVPLKNKWD
jgi:hypothetical protein